MIPADWEVAHALVVAGALRARVSLADPEAVTRAWSDDLEEWISIPAGPYATQVPARVQRLNGQARDVVSGEAPEVVLDHLVVVPWGMAEVRPGHLVTVSEASDRQLVGAVLQVHHVVVGSERFERDLFCRLA